VLVAESELPGAPVRPILPGATVGVLGSGQLGRMLALAAHRMGYRIVVFSPDAASPAGRVADREVTAGYDDEEALASFAASVDVVTVEFENVPAASLEFLEAVVPVRPGPAALFRTQDRSREKEFLAAHGFPHAPTMRLEGPADFGGALAALGTPAVLKTAGFGYDGKGQLLVSGPEAEPAALNQLRAGPGVLERFIEFEREISVVLARGVDGSVAPYRPLENTHVKHVLDVSRSPAACSAATERTALELAREIADALEVVGVLCVEFFEKEDGELLVNEIAPRPHNSGHLTIEACPASQFEQQLRAVCGLPLGDTELLRPAAMANLMGDLWNHGEPDWASLLAKSGVALHLYGKAEPRMGRKMGHLTALRESPARASEIVQAARGRLEAGRRSEGSQRH
jgi:5-(carboxyamino)imidazole ribonucleotide synthase